jgi:hypothetical protein
MSQHSNHPPHADICLLLRSHFEERWLSTQVLPVLCQLERPGSIPDDQLGAAFAYLELTWLDAGRRATQTEGAFRALLCRRGSSDARLGAQARRLHAAVRMLRDGIGRRVARLIAPPGASLEHEHAII